MSLFRHQKAICELDFNNNNNNDNNKTCNAHISTLLGVQGTGHNDVWYNDSRSYNVPLSFKFLRLSRQLLHHVIRGKLVYSNLRMSKYHCAIHIHSELCMGVHPLLRNYAKSLALITRRSNCLDSLRNSNVSGAL